MGKKNYLLIAGCLAAAFVGDAVANWGLSPRTARTADPSVRDNQLHADKAELPARLAEGSFPTANRTTRIRALLDMIAEIREREGGLHWQARLSIGSAMDTLIDQGQLETANELYHSLACVIRCQELAHNEVPWPSEQVAASHVRVLSRMEGTAAAIQYIRQLSDVLDTYIHPSQLARLWAELVQEAVRNGDLFDATMALSNAEADLDCYAKASGTLAKTYAKKGDTGKSELIITNMVALLKTSIRKTSIQGDSYRLLSAIDVPEAIVACIQAGFPEKGMELWQFCASDLQRKKEDQRAENEGSRSMWRAPDPSEQEIAREVTLKIVGTATFDLMEEWLQLVQADHRLDTFSEGVLKALARRGDDEFAFPVIVIIAEKWGLMEEPDRAAELDYEAFLKSAYHLHKAINSEEHTTMTDQTRSSLSCIRKMQDMPSYAETLLSLAEIAEDDAEDIRKGSRCERTKGIGRDFLEIGWQEMTREQRADRDVSEDVFALSLALDDITVAEENYRLGVGRDRIGNLAKLAAKAGELGQIDKARSLLEEIAEIPYQSATERLLAGTTSVATNSNLQFDEFDLNKDGTVDLDEIKAARASRGPERTGLDRFTDCYGTGTGFYVLKARTFVSPDSITREEVARFVQCCSKGRFGQGGFGDVPFGMGVPALATTLVNGGRPELAAFVVRLQNDMMTRQIQDANDIHLDYLKESRWDGFIYLSSRLYKENPVAALILNAEIGDEEKRGSIPYELIFHELTTGDLENGLRWARVLGKESRDKVIAHSLARLLKEE